MTKPDVETWLSQMPLVRPSAELEQRMSGLFAAGVLPSVENSVTATESRSIRQPWGGMAVVAVVCLLMGVVTGQWMHRDNVFETSEQRAEFSVGGDSKVTAVTGGPESVQLRDVLSDSERVVRTPFWSEIQGPRVTMLCALRVGHSGGSLPSGVEQCLQCHSGLPDAESQFLQTHMLNPRFATCAWCHDHSRVSGPQ